MAAVLPLLGVVVGAALTAGFTWWADQRRWKREDELRQRNFAREDRQRWLQDRRRLYALYLDAAHQAEQHGRQAQSGFYFAKRAGESGDPRAAVSSNDAGMTEWDRFVEQTEEMRRLTTELEIVAPSNVAQIATDLNTAVIGLVDALTRETRGSDQPESKMERFEQVEKITARQAALVEEFKRAVRWDLAVDTGEDHPPRGRE